jgi:hypothetical protein
LRIDDAAGDIEVGFGVAIVKDPAVGIRKPDGGEAEGD